MQICLAAFLRWFARRQGDCRKESLVMMCVQNKETFKRVLLRSGMVVCLFLTGCAERTADYFYRGGAYYHKAEYDGAIFYFSKAIEINPKDAKAYNGVAWLLATCPDGKYRDGRKAVENATRACELSQWAVPALLDTLAAAYAEVGEFKQAVKWQSKAIELTATENDKAAMQSRLKLYKAGKPYREEKDKLR